MNEKKPQSNAELMEEVNKLRALLLAETDKRTAAEEHAHALATASPYMDSTVEEKPTGNTITERVCINKWEKDAKKMKFESREVQTYYYNIQLPVGAGTNLSTNGQEYYHGETYEFTQNELADIKSRVARCWDHEKSIHGGNENMFRKPSNIHLKTKAAIQRGL